MKKLIGIVFLLFTSASCFACKCFTLPLVGYFNRSDFVATAKIIAIERDALNPHFQNIEVELIQVFKGQKTTKLKLDNSCGFFTPKGSTWLVFASFDKNRELSFEFCSGSLQLTDRKYLIPMSAKDSLYISKTDSIYNSNNNVKLSILSLLRKKKISNTNLFDLKVSSANDFTGSIANLGEKIGFSIIEVTINSDLSIRKIKQLRKFNNANLQTKLRELILDMHFTASTAKTIPPKAKLYLVYYYETSTRNELGYLSTPIFKSK